MNVSSSSAASFQEGCLWNGVGEAAGVGGETGAEGSIFIGKEGRTAIAWRVGPETEGRDLTDLIESE